MGMPLPIAGFPVSWDEKHPHNMMFPASCLTDGMVLMGLQASLSSSICISVFVMGWAGPWAMGWAAAGLLMGWAGLEFWALDGPGLEF